LLDIVQERFRLSYFFAETIPLNLLSNKTKKKTKKNQKCLTSEINFIPFKFFEVMKK